MLSFPRNSRDNSKNHGFTISHSSSWQTLRPDNQNHGQEGGQARGHPRRQAAGPLSHVISGAGVVNREPTVLFSGLCRMLESFLNNNFQNVPFKDRGRTGHIRHPLPNTEKGLCDLV